MEFKFYTYLGCPTITKLHNPYERKLGPIIISFFFIDYLKRFKGNPFYCLNHHNKIMESSNAKLLEMRILGGVIIKER